MYLFNTFCCVAKPMPHNSCVTCLSKLEVIGVIGVQPEKNFVGELLELYVAERALLFLFKIFESLWYF